MATTTTDQPKRKILLCYDGSAEAARALERVAEIAAAVPAVVTIVSVAGSIYPEPPWTGYADPAEAEVHRRLLEDAARTLSGRGIVAETVERTGDPAESILDVARTLHVDLIAVGSHQHGLVELLLVRSVSAKVAGEAPCDVLVVR